MLPTGWDTADPLWDLCVVQEWMFFKLAFFFFEWGQGTFRVDC